MLLGQGRDGGIGIAYAGYVSVFQGIPQPAARSAYLKQVERIAPPDPPGLLDRDAELAELARFCLDPGAPSYTWWRAGPWAGKSALLSAFVLRPPAEVAERVRIVSFFITARLAAQDTREAFTDVLLEQLAALLGQPLPSVLPLSKREAYLLDLMSCAAVSCQESGGRLVLVVDGLDEDRGVTTGADAHSIAGLLPASPPAGMRVIVAGRPNPPVPEDVPDWHPLRDPTIVRPLPASPHARDRQRLARQELQRLLHGSPAEQDLLGQLAAARGGLSAWDLAKLAGVPRWEATDILYTLAGRTFSSRPSRLNRRDVYLLQHEELQAAAVDYLGDRIAGYRERLHSWAIDYRARGWPAETPEYLVAGYFRLLEDIGDLTRMTECALDLARHDRMLNLTGGDSAGLTEVRTTLNRIAAQDKPDLASALALACHRDHLSARNANIPVRLPAVWAALGQLLRAEALAMSIADPGPQASALAQVAETLAVAGQNRQAESFAAQAEAIARSITPIYFFQASALADVAGALVGAGQQQEAEAIARSIAHPEWQAHALAKVAEALARAGQVGQAESLAAQAATMAHSTTADPRWQAHALAQVAGALATAGQQQEAEAIARSIAHPERQAHALGKVAEALARAGQLRQAEAIARAVVDPEWQAHALAEVAEALARAGQDQQAVALGAEAAAMARSVAAPGSELALAEVAGALVRAGLLWTAEAMVRSFAHPGSYAQALVEVAGALAGAGQHQQAEAFAAQAEAMARSLAPSSEFALAEVAGALAGAGQLGQAEATVRSIVHPGSRARALAAVAEALAAAGRLRQAEAFAAQAKEMARSVVAPEWQVHVLAEVAGALAKAGQHQQAEATARSIVDQFYQERALAHVAGALAGAGQLRQAEVIAHSIIAPEGQVGALAEIAGALARAGQLRQAETFAAQAEALVGSIADQELQMIALADVAGALAAAGQHRQAEATARSIGDAEWQSGALADVAGALAAAGQLGQAEAMAYSIADQGLQGSALAQVAVALAQAGDFRSASRVAVAACAVGQWTVAVRPVLLLVPSAFTALARTLEGQHPVFATWGVPPASR